MNSAPLQSNCFVCGTKFTYQPIRGRTVWHYHLCGRCIYIAVRMAERAKK